MNERTFEIEVPLLLPDVPDGKDKCLDRLEAAFSSRKGIRRAHLERENAPTTLCIHFDPTLVSIQDVRRMVQRAGASISNRYHHRVIPVEGMDCSDCSLVLEHSIARLDGVLAVSVSYTAQTVQVEYDSQVINQRRIERLIHQLGYRVTREGVRSWYLNNRELVFALAAGALLLTAWLGERFLGFPSYLYLAAYASAYSIAGFDIARHAIQALRQGHLDTNLLMVTAALGAAFLGEFAEGSVLLFLYALGHALEDRVLDRTRNAIRALSALSPKSALVRRAGHESEVPIEQLQLGDIVIVQPGARIPADGQVQSGTSAVNESPVTGESMPVEKGPGDRTLAGSLNGDGALEIRVSRLAKESTLARVQQMIERAQAQKAPTQQVTERFARIFVPAVLVGDIVLLAVLSLMGMPLSESVPRALTLLVAASPCALALAAPSAVLAGIAQAARHGVLVKGGIHLENLGRLRAIAFDKTGTVTEGRAQVTDVVPFGGQSESEVLSLLAAAEAQSTHPIARAILGAAEERRLTLPKVSQITALAGLGIEAQIDGSALLIGSTSLIEGAGIKLPASARSQVEALEDQGKTAILLGVGGKALGVVGVADAVRPEAGGALQALKRHGLQRTVMLTGDNSKVAAYIARQAGILEFRAGLMPQDKLKAVQELASEYGVVAMVGDGVNDAPALAQATVGIAMGGAGTDVALETADVALMADDLSKLPFAIGLGHATRAVIQQNLALSLTVIMLLLVLGLGGFANIGVAILLHEGSTIIVALNSLRLLRHREKRDRRQ